MPNGKKGGKRGQGKADFVREQSERERMQACDAISRSPVASARESARDGGGDERSGIKQREGERERVSEKYISNTG